LPNGVGLQTEDRRGQGLAYRGREPATRASSSESARDSYSVDCRHVDEGRRESWWVEDESCGRDVEVELILLGNSLQCHVPFLSA